MSQTTPIIAVRSVSKSYGDNVVLDDLSFDLQAGRSLVVLGRSGSGKSVLLRLIDGLEKPDSGSIHVGGQDVVPLSEHELYPVRRRIGMLFQGGALFDSMPVRANLAFPLRRQTDLEEEQIQARAEAGLERVGLGGSSDLYPSSLSGGMKKRAALARSLMLEPEVMLYDEPTTGLDPVTSASIGRLIRQVQESAGVAAVVVTHDIPVARAVADEVAFLHEGRFAYHGDWSSVDSCPQLADFLAARESLHAA